jgi:hypothetical protein
MRPDDVDYSFEQQEAATALRQIGTNGVACVVEWVMFQPPPPLNPKLLRATTRLPDFARVRVWSWLAKRGQVNRVAEVAKTLQALGPEAEKLAIPGLVRKMRQGNARQASQAMWVLAECGRPGFAALLAALADRQFTNRLQVPLALVKVRGLGANASPAVPLLLDCLANENGMARAAAAATLEHWAIEPRVVVPALIRSLNDPNPTVRVCSANGLRRFGKAATPAVAALIAALDDPDGEVRARAAEALLEIAPDELVNEMEMHAHDIPTVLE